MLGWDNFGACWFVMNIYSALTAPSSVPPASGLRFGGVSETRSRKFALLLLRFPSLVFCSWSRAQTSARIKSIFLRARPSLPSPGFIARTNSYPATIAVSPDARNDYIVLPSKHSLIVRTGIYPGTYHRNSGRSRRASVSVLTTMANLGN